MWVIREDLVDVKMHFNETIVRTHMAIDQLIANEQLIDAFYEHPWGRVKGHGEQYYIRVFDDDLRAPLVRHSLGDVSE